MKQIQEDHFQKLYESYIEAIETLKKIRNTECQCLSLPCDIDCSRCEALGFLGKIGEV